jgi:hypothetical protein
MNRSTSLLEAAENALSSEGEPQVSGLVDTKITKVPTQIEADADRLRSSVARLTSNSIEGLERLTSELQELQAFLKSEVERVHGEIESALAGIKIIIETIAPWKTTVPIAPPSIRGIRGGPAANIESAQSRR